MLETATLDKLLARALRHGGDYADIFCERRRSYAFRLQDGHIHEGQSAITQGVGIRVVIGETAGYAYSDDLSLEALLRAAEAASLVARTLPAGDERRIDLTALSVPPLYDQNRNSHADASRYVALLETADATARKFDSRIVAVNAHVTDELQDVWIATSEGRYVHDHRPMVTLGVQAVASRDGERGIGLRRRRRTYVDRVFRRRRSRSAGQRCGAYRDHKSGSCPRAGRRDGNGRRFGRRRRVAPRSGGPRTRKRF